MTSEFENFSYPLGTTALNRLPVGDSNFSNIRLKHSVYVDKTDLIYNLTSSTYKFFLSRPRRFGKTMLVNTMESLFLYGTRDFKGLAIESLWDDDGTYDVMHVNFAEMRRFNDAEAFRAELCELLDDFMQDHPVADPLSVKSGTDPMTRFAKYLTQRPLGRLVVLIDEYDTPLTNCLENKQLFDAVSNVLCQFYQILKNHDGALRFMFVTGICRFQHLGLFSGPNQFIDISMDPEYGTIVGYTVEELGRYFSPYIENAALALGISYDECFEKLKFHYDGFCFDEEASTHVFSPWSVLNFLYRPRRGFKNYWYNSAGEASVLLNYLKNRRLQDPEAYGQPVSVSPDVLSSSKELASLNDIAMLFHTGYLTIKGLSPSGNFIINTSNNEVSCSLAKLNADHCLQPQTLDDFSSILLEGSPDEVVGELNRFFTSLDYKDFKLQDESSVRSVLQLSLMAIGLNPKIEVHNHKGRSDLEVRADARYFVFEIKYHREGAGSPEALLEEAVAQIADNHYGEQNCPELPHIRIALVFSQKERCFVLSKIF